MDPLLVVERCVAEHAEPAWRLAFALMGNAADADDVVQQALIIAWRKARRAPADPWPWLAGIIAFEARNARRKRAYRNHAPLKEAAVMTDHDPALVELHAAIRLALHELPEPQREAVALTYISGLTQEEAARLLNVPLNTLKSRIRRGMDALRERIQRRDPDIAQGLLTLPILPPMGGFAAARAEWVAIVHHHAVAAAAAGGGAVNVKLMAAFAASVLLVAALLLWLNFGEARPSLQMPEFTGQALPEEQPSRPRTAPPPRPEKRESAVPEAGIEQPDTPQTPPRQPAPPIDLPHRPQPRHESPAVPKEEEAPAPEPEPVIQESGPTIERMPVLWLADWPPPAAERRVSTGFAHTALRRAESEWDNERYTDEERFLALQALPNGHAACVAHIWRALDHPWWRMRDVAMRWIEREHDAKALEVLEKLLWRAGITDSRRVQLMVALLRNPTWATEANFKLAAERFITDRRAFDPVLAPVLVEELAQVRADLNDRQAMIEHRRRAALLMDINAWSPTISGLHPSFINDLRVAVECLTSHGFADQRQQETIRRSFHSGHGVVQPLMRERRTFEAGGANWRVTTIDRDHERGTKYALLILLGPQWSEEVYLPWVLGLEQEFKCYIVDYLDWERDNEADGYDSPIRPETVTRMTARIEAVRNFLELGSVGVLSDVWMAGVAAEYCRTYEAGDFLVAELWPSAAEFAGQLEERAKNATGPGQAYLQSMIQLLRNDRAYWGMSDTLREGEVAALGVGGWRAVHYGRSLRRYNTRSLAALQSYALGHQEEYPWAPMLTNAPEVIRNIDERRTPRWMRHAAFKGQRIPEHQGPPWLRAAESTRRDLISHLQEYHLIERRR